MRSTIYASETRSFLLLKFSYESKKVTVTSTAAAGNEVSFWHVRLHGRSDIGTGDFSPVLGILHVCRHAHVRSHVSPGMECLYLNTWANKTQITLTKTYSMFLKSLAILG